MDRAISSVLQPFQHSVWNEFTPLAIAHNSINLGQGFPGYQPPQFVKQALADAALGNVHQYTRSGGLPQLCEIIARKYTPKYRRQVNPLTEISIGMGASEVLLNAFIGMVDKGQEVILFEPYFDIYIPQIQIAGGTIKTVPMYPPPPGQIQWTIDFEKLEQAFNERTSALLINNPHNPTGKVYTHEELSKIAEILEKWPNVQIIADEVYEHLTFDNRPMLSIANYGNLWDRCLTISSAGKLFSVTGWKTGWGIGGENVVRKVTSAKQWASFCNNAPCQVALIDILEQADQAYEGFDNYYASVQHQFQRNMDNLIDILRSPESSIKFDPIVPEGGYFVMSRFETEPVSEQFIKAEATMDFAFAKWLTIEKKITTIPASAFFSQDNKHIGSEMVRLALCKQDIDYENVRQILLNSSQRIQLIQVYC